MTKGRANLTVEFRASKNLAAGYKALKKLAALDLNSKDVARILLKMAIEGSALLWTHSTAIEMTPML